MATVKQQAAKAAEAPAPTLDKIRKVDSVRVKLAGRKGAWVGHLVNADEKAITFLVKWIKAPQKVDREDVAKLEVKDTWRRPAIHRTLASLAASR